MSTQPTLQESWIPNTDTFGARLALLRWRMGWNQKEAALACGLSQASWRGWELDGRGPRDLAEVASKIAERTGADKYWIITGETHSGVHPSGPGGAPSPKLKPVSERGPLDYKVGDSAKEESNVHHLPFRRQHDADFPLEIAA